MKPLSFSRNLVGLWSITLLAIGVFAQNAFGQGSVTVSLTGTFFEATNGMPVLTTLVYPNPQLTGIDGTTLNGSNLSNSSLFTGTPSGSTGDTLGYSIQIASNGNLSMTWTVNGTQYTLGLGFDSLGISPTDAAALKATLDPTLFQTLVNGSSSDYQLALANALNPPEANNDDTEIDPGDGGTTTVDPTTPDGTVDVGDPVIVDDGGSTFDGGDGDNYDDDDYDLVVELSS